MINANEYMTVTATLVTPNSRYYSGSDMIDRHIELQLTEIYGELADSDFPSIVKYDARRRLPNGNGISQSYNMRQHNCSSFLTASVSAVGLYHAYRHYVRQHRPVSQPDGDAGLSTLPHSMFHTVDASGLTTSSR